MKILIILGHPDKKSFNHAIAQVCLSQIEKNGHSAYFHDLYAERFNPLHQIDNTNLSLEVDEEIKTHCTHLAKCDGIIVIHPNWWGQPPAIVKGWLDRVLLPGLAYDFELNEKGEYNPVGLLKAKVGIVLNTSNTPTVSEDDLLNSIWKNQVFKFCGVNKIERRNFSIIKESDDKQRSLWLAEVEQLINSSFPKNE